MTISFTLQNVSDYKSIPSVAEFEKWLAPALAEHDGISVVVRIVDKQEMQALNSQYRGQDKPTNVLAFPAELPTAVCEQLKSVPLGDIVICAPIVEAEAYDQEKPLVDHWAHLTVHGVLHLLGYDHQDDEQARVMETLEREYLFAFGIPDPYRL